MVGFDPSKKELSKTQYFLSSFTSGVVSRFIVQPFDVLKIRFQVQYEPLTSNLKSNQSKYKSISQAFISIFKEEGLRSLWKGHLTGQLLSTSYISLQFTSFEVLTKLTYRKNESTTLQHFLCGGASASIATICIQPLDMLKTRLVTQGEPKIYKNIAHACVCIFRNEGLRGFYKGLVPSLLLVTPQTAISFSVYEFLNICWRKFNLTNNKTLQSSLNGALSGIVAKSMIYPLDVVKRRLQVQGFEQARAAFGQIQKFNGVIDCFVKTARNEGIFGFYKGYFPSMIKSGLATSIVFLTYEQMVILFRYLK